MIRVVVKDSWKNEKFESMKLGSFCLNCKGQLERAKRSWKVPSEIGKFLFKLQNFAGVGKFRCRWKIVAEVGKCHCTL